MTEYTRAALLMVLDAGPFFSLQVVCINVKGVIINQHGMLEMAFHSHEKRAVP